MIEHAVKRAAAPPPSLKDAAWLQQSETKRVFAALAAPGIETRAVGGAVRDTLLGLPVSEVDLATTALPEKVIALARGADLKAVPTGIEHGTVTLVAGGVPFEVTTLRRDVETFGRHATVAFTEDWEEDARRRDFTLNALYAGSDGELFDPLGGYADLVAGRVRFIGDAEARIKEDYLRILRFFRFNAYYGKGAFDAEGLAACVRLRDGLDLLSAERVAGELRQLLVAPQAVRAVEALFDYGLLTQLLGGVPRLMRFERLVAAEAGAWACARRGAPAGGACGVRAARTRSGLRRACGFPMPSRRCSRLAPRTTRRPRFPTRLPPSGRSTGSGLAASRRACCLPRPMPALRPTIKAGGRRCGLPTAGRRRSSRCAAPTSWRSARRARHRRDAPAARGRVGRGRLRRFARGAARARPQRSAENHPSQTDKRRRESERRPASTRSRSSTSRPRSSPVAVLTVPRELAEAGSRAGQRGSPRL